MKSGKLPESHLKRSVLRNLNKQNALVKGQPGLGMDAVRLDTDGLVIAQAVVELPVKYPARLAVIKAMNNLLAGGGSPVGISLTLLVPELAKESLVRSLKEEAETQGLCYGDVHIIGGDVRISPSVRVPIVMVTAYGTPVGEAGQQALCRLEPDMDIVMTKWIAMEATWLLAENCRDALHNRYAFAYIDNGLEFGEHLSIAPEIAVLNEMELFARHDASYGGIFGCLWELLEPSGLGCEVEIPKIPVKQESIEFAEFYNVNPYMLSGGGSLLAVVPDGRQVVDALADRDIFGTVIGHTVKSKARAVLTPLPAEEDVLDTAKTRRRHEAEVRYLVPGQSDALFSILYENYENMSRHASK